MTCWRAELDLLSVYFLRNLIRKECATQREAAATDLGCIMNEEVPGDWRLRGWSHLLDWRKTYLRFGIKDILTISATDLDKEFYSFRYIYILYISFWICGQILHGSWIYMGIFSIFSWIKLWFFLCRGSTWQREADIHEVWLLCTVALVTISKELVFIQVL